MSTTPPRSRGPYGLRRSTLTTDLPDVVAGLGDAVLVYDDDTGANEWSYASDLAGGGVLCFFDSTNQVQWIQTNANDRVVITSGGGIPAWGLVTTASINDDAVTYAKIQDVSATDRLLGRDTAGSGAVEELTVGGGVEFTGSGGIQRSALTGDVTASAGSGSCTVISASDTAAGKIEIAVQSEQETGTDATRAVTPARQHYHPSACKGWLNYSQATDTINGSYNVAAVSDVNTGDFTVSWDTDFSNDDYGFGALSSRPAVTVTAIGTASLSINTQSLAGTDGDGDNYLCAFGDQA